MTAVRRRARVLARAGAVLLLLVVLVGTWIAWDNWRLVRTDLTVSSSALPAAFDGYRIAQVSDLHSRSFGEGGRRLADLVAATEPDAIALTGDLVDRTSPDAENALALVDRLVGIAPVYYVTGNHEAAYRDTPGLLAALEDRGVVVLRTEAVTLERDGEQMLIAGIDDPRVIVPGEAPGQIDEGSHATTTARLERLRERTATGTDASGEDEHPFTVLLSHRPEMLQEYADAGVDVVLAGHAHGGQIRIPLVGGLFAPGQGFLPKLTQGIHTRGATSLVISRGLGNSVAPIRVNDPPEVVVVTLTR